ncbi:hypothetical protein [Bradyrhizobium sp. HKCCYLR20261]|uniref:hypothetical protein n=1 Tax=unclassified Bradyrhizobium TaxID=2631580 RepID=UPI003EB7E97F
MTASNTGLDPVRSLTKGGPEIASRDIAARDIAARRVQMPMSQQNAFGSHGYDMYQQELVRLSGCQERSARREKKRALLLS